MLNLYIFKETDGIFFSMNQPHKYWSEYYDEVYKRHDYGFYTEFTNKTIAIIKGIIGPPAEVIDFGAGTGRISIPLSRMGYKVTAVDSCQSMLDELVKKDSKCKPSVKTICTPMEKFSAQTTYRLALCLFTVLMYVIKEEDIRKFVDVVFNALAPKGSFLIDIPSKKLFKTLYVKNKYIRRNMSIKPAGNNLYNYKEDTIFLKNNEKVTYSDYFLIKYWEKEFILNLFCQRGFSVVHNVSRWIECAGSDYYVLKKEVV